MSDQETEGRSLLNPPGFCDVFGCTGASVSSRWVVLGSGEDREIEVCWKHAEGELDPETIAIASG